MRKLFILLAAVYIASLMTPVVFALPDSAPTPVPAPEKVALCLENITPGTPPMGDIGGCIKRDMT